MATTTAPTPHKTGWTEEQVSEVVIDLLAELLNKDADDLRTELLDKGSALPVDSLDLFDVLAEFRQRTGIKIPKRDVRRQTMRSVRAFAAFAARQGTS